MTDVRDIYRQTDRGRVEVLRCTGVLRVHPVELLRKRAFRAHYAIIGTRTYSRIREPGAVAMVFVELQ